MRLYILAIDAHNPLRACSCADAHHTRIEPDHLPLMFDGVVLRCTCHPFDAGHELPIGVVDVVSVRPFPSDVETREVGGVPFLVLKFEQRLKLRSIRADLIRTAVDAARIVVAEIGELLFLLLFDVAARKIQRIAVQEMPCDEQFEPSVAVKIRDGGVEVRHAALLHSAAENAVPCAVEVVDLLLDDAGCRHDIELRFGIRRGRKRFGCGGGCGECEGGDCRADGLLE